MASEEEGKKGGGGTRKKRKGSCEETVETAGKVAATATEGTMPPGPERARGKGKGRIPHETAFVGMPHPGLAAIH